MSRTIEELLNTPYWIIDILPKQVPAGSAGQYFVIEKYLRDTQLSEIKKKHVNLILKLTIQKRYVNIMVDDAMIVSEPEDTYLTIYNPDEDLLTLIRELASGEGMFVWKNENS